MKSIKYYSKKVSQSIGKGIKKTSRIIWSFIFGLLGFFVSQAIYFGEYSLFHISLLGETIISAIFFLLIYFFGKLIISSIGRWLETLVGNTLLKILNEFWRVQSNRLVESIRRADTTKEKVENVKDVNSNIIPGAVVLDTSTIIDGRILSVIKTGFMNSQIVVTQNVVDELQHMADKSDTLKRQKGRRGLDTLKDIRKACGKGLFYIADLNDSTADVDKSLVSFCKKTKSRIATVDYNLNKTAQVAGIKVLNINLLANEIKTNLLPGDTMIVKLVQKGKEEKQAVAYLEDGTMLVVKDADAFVGKHKEIKVEKVLQTSAGRMIFAGLNQ